jgi:hypothetical protein
VSPSAAMLDNLVDASAQDLRDRTLSQISGALSKLIYLSSTRDFNTGTYGHTGLTLRFGEQAASRALERCHREVFREVLLMDLQMLTEDLDQYFCGRGNRAQLLESWGKLQAYRTLIPADSDGLSTALFTSNVRIALAVLRSGHYRSVER